jgi:arabinofuranosyltransferase
MAPPEREAPEPAAPRSARLHLVVGLVLPAVLLGVNMARVGSFTIDDAYISFRYARNLARGLGLVYNAGEHIEGYTNFFWTVLLAGGIRLGLDPVLLAKVLGGLAACGSLGALYLLSRRLSPYGAVPCIATWLFASSIVESGYAVFGLETPLFVFLLLAGTELLFRERDRGEGLPWSGVVFGLAGITRTAPEAAMFLGIPMLFLGRRFFGRQNLLRGAIFLVPVACHTLWRHAYYGTWLPNTAMAKLGNLSEQIAGGKRYLMEYGQHTWPVLLLGLFGLCVAIVARHRDALCVAALAFAVTGYVLVVGGDWMPYYRFMAPLEPFCFLLACLGGRALLDPVIDVLRKGDGAPTEGPGRILGGVAGLVAAAAVTVLCVFRAQRFEEARHRLVDDDRIFWESASGGAAAWLLEHGQPGQVAIADIGYLGYATDYPVLDLLGLVDPVISRLPGGYTHKTGPGYVQHIFDEAPRYFVLVGGANDCNKLPFEAQERLHQDRRFRGVYDVAAMIRHSKNGYWCVFERRAGAPARGAP